MLYVVALIFAPALAAFSFQLICYVSYKKEASQPSALNCGHREALQNG